MRPGISPQDQFEHSQPRLWLLLINGSAWQCSVLLESPSFPSIELLREAHGASCVPAEEFQISRALTHLLPARSTNISLASYARSTNVIIIKGFRVRDETTLEVSFIKRYHAVQRAFNLRN